MFACKMIFICQLGTFTLDVSVNKDAGMSYLRDAAGKRNLSGLSVCLVVCLSVNPYISYTRHYYSLQYAKNQQALRQIGRKRSLAKTKS